MFGLIMAFQEQRYDLGFLGGKFIGFKNFEFFFTTQDFWRVTSNTVGYSVTFIIMGLIAQVTLALLLFEIKKKFALKYYQTTMILPNFLSWVIVGYIAYIMLNPKMGALNQLFLLFNVKPIEWYAEPKYWPFILTFFNIWKGVGMGSIIYYASLMGINNELFEAARIDGANRWQQIMHISIPSLIPLMSILSILAFGNLFRGDFGLFYQVTRDVGILYPTTDIIDTYIYRGLKSGSLGQTAAIGMVQSLIGLVLVMGTNFVANKINPDNALF
jgi:putative aldouronate transport system permease protein